MNKDKSGTQRGLVILLTIGQMALLYIIFFVHLPEANKEIGYLLVGSYSTKWGDAVAFWYNSTFGSQNKDQVIASLPPAGEAK